MIHYFGNPEYCERLALGKVPNKFNINQSGRNESVGSTEVIVASGGVYGLPTSAEKVIFESDSLDDVVDGDGARSIILRGIDGNWDLVEEIVDINTLTVNTYFRVLNAKVYTAGTITIITGANVGTITCSQESSANEMIQILPNYGKSLNACITVPRHYSALFWGGNCSAPEGKTITTYLNFKDFGSDKPFVKACIEDLYQNTISKGLPCPNVIPEKSDIVITGKSSAVGTAISVTPFFTLIKNDM